MVQHILCRLYTEEDRGGTRLRCGRERLQLFASMLLSMGRRIEIHQPAELRETFTELGRQALLAAQSFAAGKAE